jgi:carbon storage regulator
MLVLSRKPGEEIVIPGSQSTVTVLGIVGNRVRLGVSAPREVTIRRQEIEPLTRRPPGSHGKASLGKASLGKASLGKASLGKASLGKASLAPTRVLIAAPNRCTLKSYADGLGARGAVVATAMTGLECIESLRAAVPEVLVLELNLLWGGEDGVLSMIAGEPELRPKCVMIVAQSRNPGALYRLSGFKVDDYQTSPLSADDLANRICALLPDTRSETVV